MRESKKQKLFKPDLILTRIRSALLEDLGSLTLVYRQPSAHLEVAAIRQMSEFDEKFISSDLDVKAMEHDAFVSFRKVNTHMAQFNRPYDVPARLHSKLDDFTKDLMRMRALMHFVLGEVSLEELYHECKHSSGATVGTNYSDTSPERKSTFPMSATSRAVPLFDDYLRYDPQLAEALVEFNKGRIAPMYDIVSGSIATTVEKNNRKRRFISKEPTVNMFLQQGLMQLMYLRMAVVGLNVESLPDQHKQRARMASITRAESTVDWTSASDCDGIELLRFLLPSKWFDLVWSLRSDFTSINGEQVKLNMISTMGNAVTFPLETLVFWTAGHAVRLRRLGGNSLFPEWEDLKRVSVFGDDCIVCTEDSHQFIELCEKLGFIVNRGKTFIGDIPFRESCGGDYLAGYDVRPYNVRPPHNSRHSSLEPWLYIIMNRLIKKYISYFGAVSYIYNRKLFTVMEELFREYGLKLKIVPHDFPDDAGLRLEGDHVRFLLCYRFNYDSIALGSHGTYLFRYLTFKYGKKRPRDDHIRYSMWLKKPTMSVRRPLKHTPIRRKGGYMVAKGLSTYL